MEAAAFPGFFGKIPRLGDFVSRRLPREFIDPWDDWIQDGLSASRKRLGSDWLNLYLNSPFWRFGLTPGLLGNPGWVGILMPSVDKVGRYFPLTVAAPLADGGRLPGLLGSHPDWFEGLERLALAALSDDFDLGRFDAALLESPLPEPNPLEASTRVDRSECDPPPGPFTLHLSFATPEELPPALAGLCTGLSGRLPGHYSLWCTEGSVHLAPSLLIFDGLPPPEIYSSFLDGSKQTGPDEEENFP